MHEIAAEAGDGLHAARLRQIGLGDQPDALVDAQIGVEADKAARPRQKMRQHRQTDPGDAGGQLRRQTCCRQHWRPAVQQALDPAPL